MSFQVVITEDAENDLEAIATYIAKHDSPKAAQHVLSRILAIADSLSSVPTRGTAPKEFRALGDQEFRQILFKPYRLIYRVSGKRVVIYVIADGRRDVLGGNGYTEELPLARIAREMPVNSIWEGSGNIMCLDVLRAFGKGAGTRDAVLKELLPARGRHPAYDAAFERFAALGAAGGGGSSGGGAAVVPESQARHFTVAFVTLAQAAVLLGAAQDAGSRAVAEGFCATRLSPESGWGAVYGAGGANVDVEAVLARAWTDGA